MLSTTLAVLVLAVTPASAINGGTPEQQLRVKAILDRLPDCITAPDGVPVAVKIVLDAFFKIRFDNEFEIWTNDPIRKEYEADLHAKLEEAQRYRKARRAVPEELLQEICDLHDELRAMYTETGLPARFRNDRHAAKQPEFNHAARKTERGGAEFFGIAIETLVGDHGRFCKQFTPAEQSWLATELGDCLGGLPGKADCFETPSAGRTKIPAASGAGMLRD